MLGKPSARPAVFAQVATQPSHSQKVSHPNKGAAIQSTQAPSSRVQGDNPIFGDQYRPGKGCGDKNHIHNRENECKKPPK